TNSWDAKKITARVARVCATTAQVAGEAALRWSLRGSSSSSSSSPSLPPRISRRAGGLGEAADRAGPFLKTGENPQP
ncbi:hypothetical protein, partial [Actinacidiphila oryziradicis]|uniref:hypothetical protein n=1 Tax=Actinacidiphila oryziradicis TaxID=2571141 RepID=UPI00145DFCC3